MASMANVRELFPPFFFFSFLTFFLTEPFAELFVVFFVDFPAGLFSESFSGFFTEFFVVLSSGPAS